MLCEVIEAWLEYVLLPECDEGDWIVLNGASYWRRRRSHEGPAPPQRPPLPSEPRAPRTRGSGRHVVEEKIWPICEAAGVSLLWLPTRSPWCAFPSPAHPIVGPVGSAASAHASRAYGRFNPIEKFNGWLKDKVAEDILHGHEGASRDNMIETVHSAIERRADTLPQKCQGWIDFLFGA